MDPDSVVNLPYDSAVANAVERRWAVLWAQFNKEEVRPKAGTVRIEFKLLPDGKVTDINTLKNEVGEPFDRICKQAIIESAPFSPWPNDMQKLVEKNFREVVFTFNYR